MDKICAIVDTQGFQFADRFVAREVAVVSEYISQCQELNTHLHWKQLSEEDQKVVLHSTKFKHGLFYQPFNAKDHCYLYNSEDIGFVLQMWYDMIKTSEQPCFGCKNQALKKILIENEIPFIDLDEPEYQFLSYDAIQKKYGDNYLCSYHKKPPKFANYKLICAYRKCAQIYRELNERIPNLMDI